MKQEDLGRARTAFVLAQKDLEAAALLLNATGEQHQNCGLHLQQAVEKLVKALIYLRGGTFDFRRGHAMGYLRGKLEEVGEALDPKFERLDALEIYAVDGRYLLLPDTEREDLSVHKLLAESLLEHVAYAMNEAENTMVR